jgi:serine/threonine protein kinase
LIEHFEEGRKVYIVMELLEGAYAPLRYPYVILLIIVGTFASGCYLVPCLLLLHIAAGGELLNALAECGAYTEKDAQSCFIQLLRVLKFLHSKGIIHRDLKLENLIRSQPGAQVDSDIKLIDFGMAKFASEPETEESVIGTPLYVSPEILMAASKDGRGINPYSFAVIPLRPFSLPDDNQQPLYLLRML